MFKNIKKTIKKAAVFTAVAAQIASVGVFMPSMSVGATPITRQVENLDRGVVAVKTDDGVFVSWRRLGTEAPDTNFALYRDGQMVTSGAVTNFVDKDGTKDSTYIVATNNATMSKPVSVLESQYIDIPLQDTPVSEEYDIYTLTFATYAPGDSTVGDLDGDGQYEIIMMWNPSNAKDAATVGATDKVFIDAYKLDGTRLWRIDMGVNIRAGAHDTQLLCADFNSDGKAELIVRTADGTVSGTGQVIGDASKNWGELNAGKNLQGPLFLTAFDGETGAVLDTVDFDPQTDNAGWDFGDNYGNRSERYLATIAWLDGVKPYAVEQRGYYPGKDAGPGRTVISTYELNSSNKLVKKWRFDTNDEGNAKYIGQGNHSIVAGDVDDDGYDEIISGSLAMDHDGKVLWCTGYGHGDAHHLGDFDPTNPGYEFAKCYEGGEVPAATELGATENQIWGTTLQDAKTGRIMQTHNGIKDTGRCMITNLGYKDKYYVLWGAGSSGYWDSDKNSTGDLGLAMNGRIYWDGGLTDQLQDHVTISKWNNDTNKAETIFTADGNSINGTKGNVNMQADILGDWREEIVTYKQVDQTEETIKIAVESAGGREYDFKKIVPTYVLRVVTTTIPTEYNFSTFMHDDLYRIGAATYNVAYNQPPHISFYLSDTLDGYKEQPTPNVTLVPNKFTEDAFDSSKLSAAPATPSTPAAGSSEVKLVIDSTTATINGVESTLDSAPVIVDGRTLVPVRFISEAIGASVDWDAATSTAIIALDGKTIKLPIGAAAADIDGNAVALDVPAQIINDRTMVPIRFISENFGANVGWDGDTRTVTVTK